ncbi:hypothetical protein [Fischerella sp. PCC 9605]|uniref:hypothetical protein n=1 Tax=Fischerella sp. PCC 9605 TaxID=1173024 RepID=UPI003FA43DD0
MLIEEIEGKRNRISPLSFLRNSAIMVALHIYFCTLLFKSIIWWKLLLAWFILFQFFGWLLAGMKGVSKKLGIWGLISDVGGALIVVWVIEKFIV